MILMNVKIDNFFAFKNFEMNMSYPKKIVGSYIENEHLKDRENFRYKKVNIIMGANATGKSTFASILMYIFNFIKKRELNRLLDCICDKAKEATIEMDFVVSEFKLYRFNISISYKDGLNEKPIIKCLTRVVDINKRDNYESCVDKIEKISSDLNDDIDIEIEKIKDLKEMGWIFSLPNDDNIAFCAEEAEYSQILDYTLRTLDPAILKVEKLNDVENSYVIRMKERDLIIQDGEVIKNNILSSGTREGIDIALVMTAIICGRYGFYYCDEKFSYVHSDIEKVFLSVMINKLKEDEQLFFTTHNLDILDLPLPKHSYTFLKKDMNYMECPIRCLNAADYLKRNTDSLRNAVENDLFSTAPNLSLIYEMAELLS